MLIFWLFGENLGVNWTILAHFRAIFCDFRYSKILFPPRRNSHNLYKMLQIDSKFARTFLNPIGSHAVEDFSIH